VDITLTTLWLLIFIAGSAGGLITFALLSRDRSHHQHLRRKCDLLDQLAALISNASLIAQHCITIPNTEDNDSYLVTLADDLRRIGRLCTQLQLLDDIDIANAGFKQQAVLCRVYNYRQRSGGSIPQHLVAKFERVIHLRKVWALGLITDRYQQIRKEL
jgi:hypothetical protein